MGFWDDLWDAIRGLFGGEDPNRPGRPGRELGPDVNIRVREEGGGNKSVGGALVTIGVRGEKVTRGTTAEGWARWEGVDPGPRHLFVEKKGFFSHNEHFEVEAPETFVTVAIRKGSTPSRPPAPPSPGPTPPMTSDKITALRRVAEAFPGEYSTAHGGHGAQGGQWERFVRRAAACLHYGAPTLGIRADSDVKLNGKRRTDVVSQDVLWTPDGLFDFILAAGTHGTDLNRIVWNRVDRASNGKAIQPDRGLVPKASSGGHTPPEGAVKGNRHAFTDRRGPFVAVGATYFPAMWLLKHNPARLDENLNWLSRRGVDFIRYFVEVGGPHDRFGEAWTDREINPHEPRAQEHLAELIERVYSFGMRNQITIFGGTGFSSNPTLRARTVEQVARVINGREPMIMYVEIGNESWQTFGGSYRGELRSLAAHFRSREPNILLALTAPRTVGETPALYGGSAASVMTIHVERSNGPGIRLEDVNRLSNVPLLKSSGEPRGPGASAGGDVSDPDTLVNDFKKTIAAGVGAYVYHSEAGIWAGSKNAPHMPNLRDQPNADAIVRGIIAARDQMRGDEANR